MRLSLLNNLENSNFDLDNSFNNINHKDNINLDYSKAQGFDNNIKFQEISAEKILINKKKSFALKNKSTILNSPSKFNTSKENFNPKFKFSKISTKCKTSSSILNNNILEDNTSNANELIYYNNNSITNDSNNMIGINNDEENLEYSELVYGLEEVERLFLILAKNKFFSDFDEQTINTILENLIEFQVNRNRIIFNKGDLANFFYILVSGNLEYKENDNKNFQIIRPFETVGEEALLETKINRKGSLKVISNAKILILEGNFYRKILKDFKIKKFYDLTLLLNEISIFKNLPKKQKLELAEKLILKNYNPGDYILKSEESNNNIFLVKEGEIEYYNKAKNKTIKNKKYFGEISLIFKLKSKFDIYCLTKSKVYILTKSVLKQVLSYNYKFIITLELFKTAIYKNEYFNSLLFNLDINKDKILKSLETKKYKEGDYILNNEEGDKFIFLVEGSFKEVFILLFNLL